MRPSARSTSNMLAQQLPLLIAAVTYTPRGWQGKQLGRLDGSHIKFEQQPSSMWRRQAARRALDRRRHSAREALALHAATQSPPATAREAAPTRHRLRSARSRRELAFATGASAITSSAPADHGFQHDSATRSERPP
jgi:hypothetical protein